MSFYPHTFASADETLGKRESRKLANNTYLIRRDPDTIAVKLHSTDVLSYHSDGTVTLRSGGYETVTTKDRLNNFGPDGMRVFSDKRVWFVKLGSSETPFVSGMRFDPLNFDATTAAYRSAADDAVSDAKRMDAKIRRFVASLTPDRLSEIVERASSEGNSGDCLFCAIDGSEIVKLGRKATCLTRALDRSVDPDGIPNDHLLSHIHEDYWHASLILCALSWSGYREFQVPTIVRMHDLTVRAVRRYLRARLIVSASVPDSVS